MPVCIPNGISIRSSVFAGLTGVPTRAATQTAQRSASVAIGRICAMHAMRPNNDDNNKIAIYSDLQIALLSESIKATGL